MLEVNKVKLHCGVFGGLLTKYELVFLNFSIKFVRFNVDTLNIVISDFVDDRIKQLRNNLVKLEETNEVLIAEFSHVILTNELFTINHLYRKQYVYIFSDDVGSILFNDIFILPGYMLYVIDESLHVISTEISEVSIIEGVFVEIFDLVIKEYVKKKGGI